MAGGLPTVHHDGCDEGHTESGRVTWGTGGLVERFVPLRSLLYLSPRAGRGRFASAVLAKRSKSGEVRFHSLRLAATPPHRDSCALLRFARNPTSPACGERWRKWPGRCYSPPAAASRGGSASARCLASRSSPVCWSTTFMDRR